MVYKPLAARVALIAGFRWEISCSNDIDLRGFVLFWEVLTATISTTDVNPIAAPPAKLRSQITAYLATRLLL
jgi:hypothetical protein